MAAAGVSLSMRPGDTPASHTALTRLLVEVGRSAVRHGTMALVHVDEVQNITDAAALSQLLIALGDALAHEDPVEVPGGEVLRMLPLAVYLTGLPDFADASGARRGATFARRFQTTTLTAIDDDDLRAALQPFVIDGWAVTGESGEHRTVRLTPEAAAEIVRLCHGDPFLFQLAGERAWYEGSGATVTADEVRRGWRSAEDEAARHVARILDHLPPRERLFLEAMATLPEEERTLTRIAQEMGLTRPTEAGTTSQRLDLVRGIVTRGTRYTFRLRAVGAFLTGAWPHV